MIHNISVRKQDPSVDQHTVVTCSWVDSSRVCFYAFVSLYQRDYECECVCVCVCLCIMVRVCLSVSERDQVDNSCFCSLCRLVFQDISGRLPQVGFTHSVWEPVCILLVSNDCVLLDIIDHLRLKCLFCLLLLTHWILTWVELRKGEEKKNIFDF